MKGRVFLVKRGLGKIILEREETPLIDLPDSFENGDIVEVEFPNNDISKKPYQLVAFSSKRYYGFVIQEFNPKTGIILPTYPEITSPVLYEKTALKKRDKVSFIIKKENDKLKAIDIKSENSYKCETPIFGTLKKERVIPKEGIITEIVKEIIPAEESLNGKVTYVNTAKGFGFISTNQYQKIFFMLKWFRAFYKRYAKEGDKVDFLIKKTDKGLSVSKFTTPIKKEILPVDKQYIVINSNIKVPLQKYINVFGEEPLIGDIVYIFNNRTLKKDNTPKDEIVFKVFGKEFIKGEIKFVKEHFGFITADDKDIFFQVNMFQNFYNKTPKKGGKVYLKYKQSEKGYQVSEFGQNSEILVNKTDFVNFGEVENGLYFAYVSKNEKEIFKYNPDNLSHALSCYNTKNIPDIYKLQAINTLLKMEYTNKRITKEKLINQKIAILNRLKNEDSVNRLEYITELQKLNYNPKKIEGIDGERYSEIETIHSIETIDYSEEISIIENNNEIEEVKFEEESYAVISETEIKEIDTETEKWQINI